MLGMAIALLSAPTNLGLRPPEPGGVPGASKAPEALRDAGLHRRLADSGAVDAGVVLPGRYVDDDARRAPGRVRNQAGIVDHSRRLAGRLEPLLARGDRPLVLGGDCSALLGVGLAVRRTRDAGLIHVDGHTDFRHPGNSDRCASVAGEDLAAVVGLHWPALADIEGRGPYFEAARTAHIGCRDDDEHLDEASGVLGLVIPAREAARIGMSRAASALRTVAGQTGYWLQVDVDVLDPAWMPSVDSPDPGGLSPRQLIDLLAALAPHAIGASVTVFDPDLDPDGRHAARLVEILVAGLGRLGADVEDGS
jgi:arginase